MNKEKIDNEIVCAVTAALGLYMEEVRSDVIPPPYIVLPSVLPQPLSLWRYVGRQSNMENRTLVSMKCMRW